MALLPAAVRPGCPGVVGALVLLLAGTTLSACGTNGGTGDKGYVDGKGVITQVTAAQRKPVGDIVGETLQGKKVTLKALGNGHPVVINVWASWCPPCRAEEGKLSAAAKRLRSKAAFLGINVRDPGGKDRPLAYERRFQVPYPSLYDPSGRSLLGFPGGLTPYTIPSTLVIDSRGRVAASILGEIPSTQTVVDLVRDAEK
ncbi:MAG: TlpA family protein disulfide reductase [Actinomycetota bacterium]|nr:TlpA family protein disulfide reductase [Actinomycetota bacterium]